MIESLISDTQIIKIFVILFEYSFLDKGKIQAVGGKKGGHFRRFICIRCVICAKMAFVYFTEWLGCAVFDYLC